MPFQLSIAEETYIVGCLARGDTYEMIKSQIVKEFDRTVTSDTIALVKKRNKKNFTMIKKATMETTRANTMAILAKANNRLEEKLDSDELQNALLIKAHQDYIEDKITLEEYMALAKSFKTATIPELVSISREMHAQSSDTPPAPQDPEELKRLREALESGNEVTLNQIIFNKGNADAQPEPPQDQPTPAV